MFNYFFWQLLRLLLEILFFFQPSLRECGIEALRGALALVVQREAKDSKQKPAWYQVSEMRVESVRIFIILFSLTLLGCNNLVG